MHKLVVVDEGVILGEHMNGYALFHTMHDRPCCQHPRLADERVAGEREEDAVLAAFVDVPCHFALKYGEGGVWVFQRLLQIDFRATECLADDAALQVAVFAVVRTARIEVGSHSPVFQGCALGGVDDFAVDHSSCNISVQR